MICTGCGRSAFGARRWRRLPRSPRCAARAAQASAEHGSELTIEGGIFGPVKECGCPTGTVIEVRNLFHNIPVRRAFLKSDMTEAGHVAEMFCRVALAHPEVHLTYRSGGKLIHDLPPVPGMRERIAVFFGRELAESLLWIEGRLDDLNLWGFVGHPSQSRSTAKGQFLFLGGRYVRDRSLGHALNEAYRGLLMVGRMPVAFLHLEIPPDQVDVNVHPTKVEVRFRDPQRVYSHLLSTLRQTFLKSDLHTRLQATQEPASAEAGRQPLGRAGAGAGGPVDRDWHSAQGRLSRAWACSIWPATRTTARGSRRGSSRPAASRGFRIRSVSRRRGPGHSRCRWAAPSGRREHSTSSRRRERSPGETPRDFSAAARRVLERTTDAADALASELRRSDGTRGIGRSASPGTAGPAERRRCLRCASRRRSSRCRRRFRCTTAI